MRSFVLIAIIGLMIYGCGGYINTANQDATNVSEKSDTLRITNDSLEYEIIIIEPGFNNWLVTQFPEEYYAQSFLENRNQFFVSEYNRRVLNSTQYNADLYMQQINYEWNLDYGKEVNYLLYNYFIYFEKTYNQKL